MKVKVAACQQPLHEPVSQKTIDRLRSEQVDFVCLPEHYPLPEEIRTLREAAALYFKRKEYLSELSGVLNSVVVGGTITEPASEGAYNTCYIFQAGKELGFYRKVNPTIREKEHGILSGIEFKVFDVLGIRAGVLICADVLKADSFTELAKQNCQIAFIPTASPLRAGESTEEKFRRDDFIFLEGSRRLGCPLVKCCGVGTTFGHPIQGRSLITTPREIVARAQPDEESSELILFAELNL